ncbi:MAG TPA: head GIN domain-containing protein [Chitinophagaceae bacterium]|nr:head GIN domain-containing protein [Chitinophagaceae bacterium]
MKKLLSFLLLSAVLSASCRYVGGNRIKGDGNIVTESREASGFSSIDVGGAIRIVLTQDSQYAVKVETDSNLQPYIEVYVKGNTLYVHPEDHTNPDATKDIIVYVNTPVIKEFDASGACHIRGQNKIVSDDEISIDLSGASDIDLDLKAPKVDIELSGASTVKLRGETKDISISGSGSSDIRAFDLLAENVDLDLSGASNAEVHASVKIRIEGSGASHVSYRGNAAVSSDMSGASSVKKVE